jgi:HAD superfamily hydrolase (TIGR01490 family)
MKAAAFFDLDGTLLAANSAALWMKRERRHGRITRLQGIQAVFYIIAYKLGFIDMDKVTVKALRTVRGLEEETVRRWTHEWFRKEVTPHAAPGALAALREHRAQGHLLVLLTSASRYESEAALEFFRMDAFLCTGYEAKDGLLTGGVIRPLCYGSGKVTHAEKYAEAHGVDLGISYFYTDSITDLPMMLRVGNPRAVNPDLRLSREARRRGWPILDWRR